MPNGSLDDILHSTKAGTLDWGTRFRIAFGAAQGLAYLHHDCLPQILHRDVKSSNILLDLDYEAHVADFGIAKTLSTTYSNYMSNVAGSRGYIAPEYGYTLKVSEKSDIYSFGVVLLELVTGKRPLEPKLYGENIDIVNWVYEKVESKQELYEVLDPNCSKDDHNDMLLVLRIALLCTNMLPSNRPSMREVVMMLLEATPKPKKNFVELEESAGDSEEEEKKVEKKGRGGKQDDDTLQVLIMQ
jgi:serine/threonine protein kinase